MTLPSAIADLVAEVKRVPSLVTAQISKWNGQVQAKIGELTEWQKDFDFTKINLVNKKGGSSGIGGGSVWTKIAKVNSRWAYRIVINSTGRRHSPSLMIIDILPSWDNNVFVNVVTQIGAKYVTKLKMSGDDDDGVKDLVLFVEGEEQIDISFQVYQLTGFGGLTVEIERNYEDKAVTTEEVTL